MTTLTGHGPRLAIRVYGTPDRWDALAEEIDVADPQNAVDIENAAIARTLRSCAQELRQMLGNPRSEPHDGAPPWENVNGPRGAGNTTGSLTHSSDLTREGLA